MRKKRLIAATALMMSLCMSLTSFAEVGWQKGTGDNAKKWWYATNDAGTTWYAAKKTYQPDWEEIDGAWYAFNVNGWMYDNTITQDGYRVDKGGAWIPHTSETSAVEQDGNIFFDCGEFTVTLPGSWAGSYVADFMGDEFSAMFTPVERTRQLLFSVKRFKSESDYITEREDTEIAMDLGKHGDYFYMIEQAKLGANNYYNDEEKGKINSMIGDYRWIAANITFK